MQPLDAVISFLDSHLRHESIPDYPNARNGLQMEREGPVRRAAFAVDVSLASIQEAARRGADLLVVHHGLFWPGLQPFTGMHYRRVRALVSANLALYASHLPLDVHPEHGNNILLAREIGIVPRGSFGTFQGHPVGIWGDLTIRREALAARLDQILGGRVRMIPGGPERLERVGVITGGAGTQIPAAIAASLDGFITGEVAHHNYFDAVEGGINLFLGGHYATETWGVRSLARYVQEELGIDCFFIDQPTGM